jgi:NAD-dependent deacetylase
VNPNYIIDWVRIYILEILMRIKISAIHIVWFGEEVPALELAIELTEIADYFVVIGTSSLSAAGLMDFTKEVQHLYFI